MSRIESLEKEIESLSPDELAAFREWFLEYDAALWDQQIENDARSGRLDGLVAEAEAEFRDGKNKDL